MIAFSHLLRAAGYAISAKAPRLPISKRWTLSVTCGQKKSQRPTTDAL